MDKDIIKLKKTLHDREEMYIVRRDAITELVRSKDAGALEAILSVRGDREKIIRRKVAEALVEFDGDRSRAALCEFLSDADDDVRRNATRSLRKIGDASCITPLAKMSDDKSWFVKRSAEDTLKELQKKYPDGPAEPPAAPGKAPGRDTGAGHKPRIRQRLPIEADIPRETHSAEKPGAAREEKEKEKPSRLTATAAAVLADSAGDIKKDESRLSDLQTEIAQLREKHASMIEKHEVESAERAEKAQAKTLEPPPDKTESRTAARRPRRTERPGRPATRREKRRPAPQHRSDRRVRTTRPSDVRTVEPARRDRGANKTCPSCGEKVKQHHRICLFCGHTFGRTAKQRAKRQAEHGLRAPRLPKTRSLTGKFMLVLSSDGKINANEMATVIQKSRGIPRGDAVKMLTRSSGIINDNLQPAEVQRLSAILERGSHKYFVVPAEQRHMAPPVESIRRGKVGRSGPDFVFHDDRAVKVGWEEVLLVTCGLIRPGKDALGFGRNRSETRGKGSLRFVMDFFIREPYCVARVVRKLPNLDAIQKMGLRHQRDYFEELAREVIEHGNYNHVARGIHQMAKKGLRSDWNDLAFDDEVAFTNYGLWLLEVLEHETARPGQFIQVLVPHLSPPRFDVDKNPEHHVWREHVKDRRRHRDYRDIVRKDTRHDRKQIGWGGSGDLINWSEIMSDSGVGATGRVIITFMVILGIMTFFVVMGAMCR